ncbi:MAG: hypothetical protein LBU89_11410 [Fibromonadaceae bacterium]|jgi:hypothetical protein|nr:hypothetical protein [Fibromonadaceae bacterium]
MKKLLSILAFLPVFLFAQNTDWYTKDPNADVFEISNAEELKELATLVNRLIPVTFAGKTIVLTNDIDLEERNWTPIGSNSTNSFRGIFDGQGYTISGLLVEGFEYAGLFGYVVDGQLKNVNAVGSKIEGTCAGGLVAYYASTQPIENSSATGNVSAAAYSGGLVGYMSSSTITNSYSTGDVLATGSDSYSGGLVGLVRDYMSSSTITNSYATGDVSAATYSGGLVGLVRGDDMLSTITITSSYATGDVSATATFAGAYSCSGGLVGYMSSSTITNSYATGDVLALATGSDSYSGGLVGHMSGTITNSYATGGVSATATVSSYSSSVAYFGGIFGRYTYTESSTINSVYYNSEGASRSIGQVCNTADVCSSDDADISTISGISGKTSAELKKEATFEGWNFTRIWGIEEDVAYPYLKNYNISIDISTCDIPNIPAQPYTSNQIKPTISVSCEGANLTEGTDYTLSYGANINAGTNAGSVTITGKDGYMESITKHFAITPKPLAENAIQTITSQIYTGSDITPELTVKDGEKILENGTDYTPIFANNRNAGTTASVSITGKGNYTGTAMASFTITPKPLANNMIEAIPAQPYANGNAVEPIITVMDGTRMLVEDTHYSVEYSNNKTSGMATVTITGMGNYAGEATANFLITSPKDIEDLTITAIPDQIYDEGNPIEPLPTLKDGEYTLVLGTDYTIDRYQNNTAIGTGRVQVSGAGLYSGTMYITFAITANTPLLSTPYSLLPTPQATRYYNLKGQPLGTTKPTTPGVYIEYRPGIAKRIVVR